MLDTLRAAFGRGRHNSTAAYERHLRSKLRQHRGNRDVAFADRRFGGNRTVQLDSFRALKQGGKLALSFLKLTNFSHHERIFDSRLARLDRKRPREATLYLLQGDWLALWAQKIGFDEPQLTNGDDSSNHPQMLQTLALLVKRPKP